jgi:hypothetical protein
MASAVVVWGVDHSKVRLALVRVTIRSVSKGKSKAGSKKAKNGKVKGLPKQKCCVSKDRCKRCPIRMLKEGTLPEGYTVRKRKLVKVKKKQKLPQAA